MRSAIPSALALSLVAACMSNTGGAIQAPCSGPNCTVGNTGPLDGGDGGPDGGDGGDAGPDGGDAGPCKSFTGMAKDFCRSGAQQTFALLASGCDGTLYFDNTPYCTGVLDAGNAFDGGCNEGGVNTLACGAPALPGTITCQTGPGTTCAIVVCGAGQTFGADGGCGP
jgi:hypothetical protein